ncbi:hypothetical protein [Elizabethkingia sp. M8]|uniref:hypothetical protein n=1 Tax=Elizabethkingia sp. M8 TaxID=2796140 RepID=UPI0019043D98|nr:hypothetical protein [Elizabethkingia sp. M8]QQM25266.1 hypothetical protein JCR23_10135 [Elizabethkingia sp. M8]
MFRFVNNLKIRSRKLPRLDKIKSKSGFDFYEFNNLTNEEYKFLYEYAQPSNIIAGYASKNLYELSFKFIRVDLPELFKQNNDIAIIESIMIQQYRRFDISKADWKQIIYFMKWIMQEYERLNKAEKKHLSSEPDLKMVSAGVNNMDEFGYRPVIARIAKDWNMNIDEVWKLPYHTIYSKMKEDKIWSDIQDKYNKALEAEIKNKR